MQALILFIGFQEVIVIMVISVLVFGPKKIPEIARGLAQGVRAMREATDGIKREIMEVADKEESLKEMKKTHDEIQTEIEAAKKEIENTIGSVTRKL